MRIMMFKKLALSELALTLAASVAHAQVSSPYPGVYQGGTPQQAQEYAEKQAQCLEIRSVASGTMDAVQIISKEMNVPAQTVIERDIGGVSNYPSNGGNVEISADDFVAILKMIAATPNVQYDKFGGIVFSRCMAAPN